MDTWGFATQNSIEFRKSPQGLSSLFTHFGQRYAELNNYFSAWIKYVASTESHLHRVSVITSPVISGKTELALLDFDCLQK